LTPLFDLCANRLTKPLSAILPPFLASFPTEGLGLKQYVGSLSWVDLIRKPSSAPYRKEISPFRGILVGLFFFTVGFEIDLSLIFSKIGLVSSIVRIMSSSGLAVTLLGRAFGRSYLLFVGLMLSQVSEFAALVKASFEHLDADTTVDVDAPDPWLNPLKRLVQNGRREEKLKKL
jgi:Kef-type K+ transport system membrane component KefB